jgi:hypothetical protein
MVTRRYIFLEQEAPAAANHRVAYLRIMLDWDMEERSGRARIDHVVQNLEQGQQGLAGCARRLLWA